MTELILMSVSKDHLELDSGPVSEPVPEPVPKPIPKPIPVLLTEAETVNVLIKDIITFTYPSKWSSPSPLAFAIDYDL
jgi:hypothetical protein